MANGGEVVYGGKGQGDEFPAGQTTFSAEVTAALNANPDAIVVLAFDETSAILPELQAQGWDMSKTYFTDGNLSDYSEELRARRRSRARRARCPATTPSRASRTACPAGTSPPRASRWPTSPTAPSPTTR